MNRSVRTLRDGILTLVAIVAAMAMLVACGEDGTTDAEAAGVDDPATDVDDSATDDVDDAVEDIPARTIKVQSLYGPESLVTRSLEAWGDAVEERTGGQMTFEMYYSGSLVALPELEDALQSGLIDAAVHIPIYSPDSFPASNVVSDMGFLGSQTPVVGSLQGMGANLEMGFNQVHYDEMINHGLQPIVPLMASTPNFHLLCKDTAVQSLDDARGIRARVSSPGYGAEAESLGMTPVQLVGGEIYEGLERGIVDCVVGAITDARDMGLQELGTDWTLDPGVAFSGWSSTHLAMSKQTWDALPPAAQEILWDTAGDVFLRMLLDLSFDDAIDSLNRARDDHGIEFHTWEPDAAEALGAHQDSVAESARGRIDTLGADGDAFVDEFLELHDTWLGVVEELGYDDAAGETWPDFAASGADIDVDAFIDRIIDDVLTPNRPF